MVTARPDLPPFIRDLLTDPALYATLSGADLFALAFVIAPVPHLLRVDEAIDYLIAAGMPPPLDRAQLAARIQTETQQDHVFLAYHTDTFCLDKRITIRGRLQPLWARATAYRAEVTLPLSPKPPAEPVPLRPRFHAPTETASLKQGNRAAIRGTKPPAPRRSSSGGHLATPPPRPRALIGNPRAAPPAKLPSAGEAPARLVAPNLPPAPPRAAAAVTYALLDESTLVHALAQPPEAVSALLHVLAAHALASTDRFEDLLALGRMVGVEPHAYQVETARRVLRFFRGRALLADEVGLGKTVEALMILREYQLRGAVRRALIVVPAALVAQWVGELGEKTGITPRTTDDPALRTDAGSFWRGDGVVVASLEAARSPRHMAAVQTEPWDLVIVDEAHHVKNRTTASFKLVDGLKSRFLLLLTATPIETNLEELYNLVTLLKPGQFTTPAAFRAQFVDRKDPLSPRNRERLRGLLAEVMVRNTRADSGLALPPRYVTTVTVDPLPEERALYEAVVAFLRDHITDASSRMLASTLLLEAGSSPAAVRGTLSRTSEGEARTEGVRKELRILAKQAASVRATRKANALTDLVHASRDQMLVFTRFRDTLADLARALREAGIAPLEFHGGQSADQKQAALQAFRGGGRILLATDVGGEGQNLHHCHVLVNFDLPYNPMVIEQRIGRLHRMGQQEEVRVYNLCARGTAEERILDLLDRRLHLFELVVGEMDMVLGNLADERDLEERIIALYRESRSEDDIDRGFDSIADELAHARGRYEQVKSLDAALFGKDYEA